MGNDEFNKIIVNPKAQTQLSRYISGEKVANLFNRVIKIMLTF